MQQPDQRRTTALRLGGIAVALVLVLAVGYGVGKATGRGDHHHAAAPTSSKHASTHADGGAMAGMDMGGSHSMAATPDEMGLADRAGGYELALDAPPTKAGTNAVGFRILDEDGAPVTKFDKEFTKLLHLIIIRDDLAPSSFEHVHPTLAADGSWKVDARFATPGTYRMYFDLTPTGHDRVVLGTNVTVPGSEPAAVKLAESIRFASVDGYQVAIDTSRLAAGEDGEMTLTISKDGAPVALEPVLGTFGHAVLLRDGDHAYLHVHPSSSDTAVGRITFAASLPSAERYAAFVQFAAGGSDHVVPFTVDARHGGAQ